MTTTSSPLVNDFLNFLNDIPFSSIVSAVESGGTNIVLDISTAEDIVGAIVKDFFGGGTPTTAASAVTSTVTPGAAS
jgi:hypothetical protein